MTKNGNASKISFLLKKEWRDQENMLPDKSSMRFSITFVKNTPKPSSRLKVVWADMGYIKAPLTIAIKQKWGQN